MVQKHWIFIAIIGSFLIICYSLFSQAISFNNQMIALQQRKSAETEVTKVEYGQCIVKILETNSVAKSYIKEVNQLANKAGENIGQFHHSLMALMGTKVIPSLSTKPQEIVQQEIISCRNAYIGRVDYRLKPLYVEFNRLQLTFPNSLYNHLLYHWRPEYLKMPKNATASKAFATGKIQPLKFD